MGHIASHWSSFGPHTAGICSHLNRAMFQDSWGCATCTSAARFSGPRLWCVLPVEIHGMAIHAEAFDIIVHHLLEAVGTKRRAAIHCDRASNNLCTRRIVAQAHHDALTVAAPLHETPQAAGSYRGPAASRRAAPAAYQAPCGWSGPAPC